MNKRRFIYKRTNRRIQQTIVDRSLIKLNARTYNLISRTAKALKGSDIDDDRPAINGIYHLLDLFIVPFKIALLKTRKVRKKGKRVVISQRVRNICTNSQVGFDDWGSSSRLVHTGTFYPTENMLKFVEELLDMAISELDTPPT